MKHYFLILLCVLIILDNVNSCKRNILKSKERRLKTLKDSSVSDVAKINRLQNEIQLLKTRCHGYKGISITCWNSSYVCLSKGYVSGCPCWTYAVELDDKDQIKSLIFNQFYQTGVQAVVVGVQTPEIYEASNITLESCDYVKPPWPSYYMYVNNSLLSEFSHCVHDSQIDCFCSSVRLNIPRLTGNKSDESARGLYGNYLTVCDSNVIHNCTKNIQSWCPCWTYYITYMQNVDGFGWSLKINQEYCDQPYLHCSDDTIAPGCPCWEFELYKHNSTEVEYTNVFRLKYETIRNNLSEDETQLDLFYKDVCRHDDLIRDAPVHAIGALTFFEHCNNNGHIYCYCGLSGVYGLFGVPDCAKGQVKVNNRCVRKMKD